MIAENIADLFAARPFRPFRLHLADGRSVSVFTSDVLTVSRDGRVFSVFDPGSDELELIDISQVVSIRIPETGGLDWNASVTA
ncbi:MAG TPA: hypothetical protein VF593_09665 [Chthoniobacteraceae bacterium]|jgi:hypothetical protein